MPSGIIIKGIGGFYYVKSEGIMYECRARGIFRKDGLTPLPGDRVSFSIINEQKNLGNIDEIMPRQSCFVRPAVSNVNQFAVVLAVKSPSTDFMLLDKLLLSAEKQNINAIICINKMDLDENDSHKIITEAYTKAGYRTILLSSELNIGYDELEGALSDKITVFAGQSGVGKSTILNHIMDSRVMETGDISEKIERGKHTTRHAELVELKSGGYIVDTPGFSSFELADIKFDELEHYYPEFIQYLNQCKFTGCSHIAEPECSIKEALKGGFIDQGRYERYIQFYDALKQIKDYKSRTR